MAAGATTGTTQTAAPNNDVAIHTAALSVPILGGTKVVSGEQFAVEGGLKKNAKREWRRAQASTRRGKAVAAGRAANAPAGRTIISPSGKPVVLGPGKLPKNAGGQAQQVIADIRAGVRPTGPVDATTSRSMGQAQADEPRAPGLSRSWSGAPTPVTDVAKAQERAAGRMTYHAGQRTDAPVDASQAPVAPISTPLRYKGGRARGVGAAGEIQAVALSRGGKEVARRAGVDSLTTDDFTTRDRKIVVKRGSAAWGHTASHHRESIQNFSDNMSLYLIERKFNVKKRQKDAKKGYALPDGSFPIENAEDLHNAMQLSGRSKHGKATVLKHIRKRAAALGVELDEAYSTYGLAAGTASTNKDLALRLAEIDKRLKDTLAKSSAQHPSGPSTPLLPVKRSRTKK